MMKSISVLKPVAKQISMRSVATNANRRAAALEIFNDALKRADPYSSVFNFLNNDECVINNKHASKYDKVIVVGGGKGAIPMVQAADHFFNNKIIKGEVVTKYKYSKGITFNNINIIEAAHPVPDQNSVLGSQKIIECVKNGDPNTLVVSLISGGGSALLCYPSSPLTLEDVQKTTKLLLESGADIIEMNCIRKHLSSIKGGNLAKAAYPSPVLSLVLSDVMGDDLSSIASGPTYPDKFTYQDCRNILKKYNIWDRVPKNVQQRIQSGVEGKIPETPKMDDPCFKQNLVKIVGNNDQSLDAACVRARSLGYTPLLMYSGLEGEANVMATKLVELAKKINRGEHELKAPVAIIAGGETVVKLDGKQGMGGRNQEFALKAALELQGQKNITVLCSATDGSDGPTDASGGVVDENTIAEGKALGLDAMKYYLNKDSYNYFKKLPKAHIVTGPTGTNVMDVAVILIDKPAN